MKKIFYISGFLLLCNFSFAQESTADSLRTIIKQAKNDTTKVKLLLDLSKTYFGSNPNKAISISEEAYDLSTSLDYNWGVAYSFKNIGNGYYFISDYVEALVYWKQAKIKFEEINDKAGEANMLSNMGAVYSDQGFHVKALELFLEALGLAEEINDIARIATVTQNIGSLHENNYNLDEALKAYSKALPLFETLDNADGIGLTSNNIAEVYYQKKNYDSAQYYAQKSLKYLEGSAYNSAALKIFGLINIKQGNYNEGLKSLHKSYEEAIALENDYLIAESLTGMAISHEENGNLELAIEYYEKAKIKALEISDSNNILVEAYSNLIRLYREIGNNRKVNDYRNLYQATKDRMVNIESIEVQNRLIFDYEITRKEQEIELLIKDNEIKKAGEEKQKLIKNGFLYGFILMLVFASVFFLQRNKIQKGKKLSDKLLHNILPDTIAEELKLSGQSVAKDFKDVSVLFSDFEGFTSISENLTAQELVAEINICFKAFDKIITTYGIEKIKTIGDAYMAAGGLHIPRTSTATDVVLAGLEMQAFIKERKNKMESAGKPFFEMRIGIHTGPVVAGIVGDKKFQYDIWGDTVNVASRMESNGEVGKVNISEVTYNLVKEDGFQFEQRGKIKAKNKGELFMYFVSKS